jgi:hypothetical protein
MNTDKAEKEIEDLLKVGYNFKYIIDNYIINKFMFKFSSFDTIISKLKDNEKILFYLNDGCVWNGKMGNDNKVHYITEFDGSIYWWHENYGNCIRIDSDMGSVREYVKEFREINEIEYEISNSRVTGI